MIPVLISAILDPDEKEFMISLYNNYHGVMFSISYGILNSKEAAEDAVSAALVKLVGKTTTLMQINSAALRSYIVNTTKNTALDIATRNTNEQKRAIRFDFSIDEFPAVDDVERTVLKQETVRRMADALNCLRARDRDLIRMKYFDNMSDGEIAAVIHTKVSTVRMCLSRARQRLMSICEEKGIEL